MFYLSGEDEGLVLSALELEDPELSVEDGFASLPDGLESPPPDFESPDFGGPFGPAELPDLA